MPNQIRRVSDIIEGSSFEPHDTQEVLPTFDFPTNLKDMSWEQKEQLKIQYDRHVSTVQGINYTEFLVDAELGQQEENDTDFVELDVDDIAPIVGRNTTYQEGVGFIVPGEDEGVLISKGLMETPEPDYSKPPIKYRQIDQDRLAERQKAREEFQKDAQRSIYDRATEARFDNL